MRKISKTLTLMGLLTPVGANALGVGEIKLHSALNQVLEAEIPLMTSDSESTSDIRVSLASPSAFANAGIERPYYLSRLRFKPVIKNGRIVVNVSSRDVISEPFLNFMIEVNWPKGRMLREFTVLLDPPATFEDSAITATRAPTVQSSTVTQPRYPVDQPINYGFRSKPSAPPPSKSAAAKGYKAGDYVWSKRNDSLWVLASRVNSDPSVTQEQMMAALYEANPHAFFKKNMNALKAGQRLQVPSRETALQISRTEALVELGRHNDQWSGKVTPAAEKTALPPLSKDQEIANKKESSESESKLKLVSPALGETVAKSSSGIPRTASAGKAELAIEMVETVRQENEELRNRLKEVEEQLARIQLMLTLKDKQLSALQSQGENPAENIIDLESATPDTDGLKPDNQVGESTDTTVAQVDAAAPPETPIAVIPDEDPGNATDLNRPAEAESQSVSTVQEPVAVEEPVDESVSPDQPAQTQSTPAPAETRPAPAVRSKTTHPNPPLEDDLLGELLSEPSYLAAGGGLAVLLGFLGWALVRRRNRILMAGTESILASPGNDVETVGQGPNLKTVKPIQNDEVGEVESSFLSEFTPSDFDALETDHDDVDPVSEADVYLAYGRYQQAEDLIRGAIENYPERDECKLKLLEIHFATEDRDAFETYARELEPLKNDKPDFWAKVAEMGREICPNSPLFGRGVTVEQTEPEDNFGETDFNSEDLDSVDPGDTDVQTETDDFEGDDLGFEVSANLDEEDESDEFAPASDLDREQESIAFSEDEIGDDHSIEFDRLNDDSSLDFANGVETDEFIAEHEDGLEENLEFANMDIGDSADTLSQPVSDDGFELSDLTDMDEIETKLDLAKAYVDMDDQESARGILTEILAEGNDVQKHEAQVLVDVLESKV